jgi:hypothetical protein
MHTSTFRVILAASLGLALMVGCRKSENPRSTTAGPQPTAAVQPKPPPESTATKLGRLGVKVQVKAPDEFLITEGFPYERSLKSNDVIEIAMVEGGIFTASEHSGVPMEMMGMVYGMGGGSFIPKCTAADNERTLTDRVGNTWIFKQAGMEFDACLPGGTTPVFTVRSTKAKATIEFLEEGVLLKGFALRPFGEK